LRTVLLPCAVRALGEVGIALADLADEVHIPLEEVERYVSTPGTPARVTVEL